MADSTIDAIPPAPPAWVARDRPALRRVRPVWLAVIAMTGFLSLCVVAADAGADELRAVHAQQVDRVAALESALQNRQLLEARAAIQLDDLRADAAAQLERLASAEGFLK